MLAIQELLRPLGETITARPVCPNCGRPMHLSHAAPRARGLANLQTYRCGECGVSLTPAAGDGSAD